MSRQQRQPIDFAQMMNEGLKQFNTRRQSIDWVSHKAYSKLIKNISSVIKCSPETVQSSMFIYIFLF